MSEYAGSEQSFYRGYARDENTFYIAALVDELVGPGDSPYTSNLLCYSRLKEWSSVWAEEDTVADFVEMSESNHAVAITEQGAVLDCISGSKISSIDAENTFSITSVAPLKEGMVIAGGNGKMYTFQKNVSRKISDRFEIEDVDFVNGGDAVVNWAERLLFF